MGSTFDAGNRLLCLGGLGVVEQDQVAESLTVGPGSGQYVSCW